MSRNCRCFRCGTDKSKRQTGPRDRCGIVLGNSRLDAWCERAVTSEGRYRSLRSRRSSLRFVQAALRDIVTRSRIEVAHKNELFPTIQLLTLIAFFYDLRYIRQRPFGQTSHCVLLQIVEHRELKLGLSLSYRRSLSFWRSRSGFLAHQLFALFVLRLLTHSHFVLALAFRLCWFNDWVRRRRELRMHNRGSLSGFVDHVPKLGTLLKAVPRNFGSSGGFPPIHARHCVAPRQKSLSSSGRGD